MKILSAAQIKELDQYTIEHEPIKSIDLMERAATACVKRIVTLVNQSTPIFVFCGKGNNGGDGLAISRLLHEKNYHVTTVIIHHSEKFSNDAQLNYERLLEKNTKNVIEISDGEKLNAVALNGDSVIIDALLGTGLNKEVEGVLADCIDFINSKFQRVISVDVPSGLFIDKTSVNNKHVVNASLCLTFQIPKLSFLFPENKMAVPEFEILDIGLNQDKIRNASSTYFYSTIQDIKTLVRKRSKFSHKGSYGHALLLAGSRGKSGAAVIAAKSCLRSGAGLITVHSNKDSTTAINFHLPEAMTSEDADAEQISELIKTENFDAIAFGPGTGTSEGTQLVLKKMLQYYAGSLIIDADGLNILSENKTWLNFLPPDTILTPHPKEFERLVGKCSDDFERLSSLKSLSIKHRIIVILKGAHTAIAMPDGNVFFNSTGNAGLAKGGSGDCLTGIILGLLARGYNAPQAALIATFVHGLAADLCKKEMSMESILITDVIEQLPKAFLILESDLI